MKRPQTSGSEPTIWKVDRFAIHDGPGIRTNLYFKGCPLHCLWCSNPEGQREERELAFSESKCTGCGRCYGTCPTGALIDEVGRASVDFGKCTHCGQCISSCLPGALHMYERTYTLRRAMDVVKRDRHIYRRSGGGITCTGGEPFQQAEHLKLLLATCQEQGIRTTVETCGYADPLEFRKALDNINWLFMDLKHVDGDQHRRLTGRDSTVILHNLRTASALFAETGRVLAIRQVIVPGLNDGDNIRAMAELASRLPRVDFVELLPYHAYGSHKYRSLGRRYPLEDLEGPPEDSMLEYKELVERYGLTCKIGGA